MLLVAQCLLWRMIVQLGVQSRTGHQVHTKGSIWVQAHLTLEKSTWYSTWY